MWEFFKVFSVIISHGTGLTKIRGVLLSIIEEMPLKFMVNTGVMEKPVSL